MRISATRGSLRGTRALAGSDETVIALLEGTLVSITRERPHARRAELMKVSPDSAMTQGCPMGPSPMAFLVQ